MTKINAIRVAVAAVLFGAGVGGFFATWTLLQHWLETAPSNASGDNTIAYFSHGEVFYLTPAQDWLEGAFLGKGSAILVIVAILAHPYVNYPWRPIAPPAGASNTWAVLLMIACAGGITALILGYGEFLAARVLELI